MPGYTDADLFLVANEVLLSEIAPELASRRASFFRKTLDQTLTVGVSTYPFNTRTIGSVVSNFFRVDAQDNSVHPLVEWDEEDLQERDPTKRGTPQAFIIEGSQIRLYPVPDRADTLRQVLLRRPNRLVAPGAAGVVTGAIINVSNQVSITIGVNYSTLNITTSTPLDISRGTPPWRPVVDDVTPITVLANTALFAAGAIPLLASGQPDVTVGDYIGMAGESPFIQLPVEFFALLAQTVAVEVLSPSRDSQALQAAKDRLKALQDTVYGVTVDRVEGQPGYLFGGDWPP